MSSHVKFTNKRKGTPKTHRWTVVATADGVELGEIRWFGRWRRYVFETPDREPYRGFRYYYFDADCLDQIAAFCRSETSAAHKRWQRKGTSYA